MNLQQKATEMLTSPAVCSHPNLRNATQ